MSRDSSLIELVCLSEISEQYLDVAKPGFLDVDGELRGVTERVSLCGPNGGQALHAGMLNVAEKPLVVKYDVDDTRCARDAFEQYFSRAGPNPKNSVEHVLRESKESVMMSGIAGGGTRSARLAQSGMYDVGRVYEDLGRVYRDLELD